MQKILDTLFDTGEMPQYYTFNQRDEVDADQIDKIPRHGLKTIRARRYDKKNV